MGTFCTAIHLPAITPTLVAGWLQGATFADVCKKTVMFEGSIIRAMRRLDELMQQLHNAAEVHWGTGPAWLRLHALRLSSLYLMLHLTMYSGEHDMFSACHSCSVSSSGSDTSMAEHRHCMHAKCGLSSLNVARTLECTANSLGLR